MKRLEYWSVGVLKRLINMRVLFAFPISPLLHYSKTPFFFYYSIIPLLHYSIIPVLRCLCYIPSTWHTYVMTAVATIILTMPVTTAEVAAYPTAEALLSHCIPRRHPERATKTPKTAL